jgi:hypothetical protein
MDYPLWHGSIPMEIFIKHKLRAERFLVEGNGIRVRDELQRRDSKRSNPAAAR